MVTVKIQGPQAKLFAEIYARALRDLGISVCEWVDCVPKDRKPYADARKQKVSALIMEMRSKSDRAGVK